MAAFHVLRNLGFMFVDSRLSGVPDWTPHIQALHLLYLVSVTTGWSTAEFSIVEIWKVCEMNRNDFLCRLSLKLHPISSSQIAAKKGNLCTAYCESAKTYNIGAFPLSWFKYQLIWTDQRPGQVCKPGSHVRLRDPITGLQDAAVRGAMAQGPWFWTTVTFGFVVCTYHCI